VGRFKLQTIDHPAPRRFEPDRQGDNDTAFEPLDDGPTPSRVQGDGRAGTRRIETSDVSRLTGPRPRERRLAGPMESRATRLQPSPSARTDWSAARCFSVLDRHPARRDSGLLPATGKSDATASRWRMSHTPSGPMETDTLVRGAILTIDTRLFRRSRRRVNPPPPVTAPDTTIPGRRRRQTSAGRR